MMHTTADEAAQGDCAERLWRGGPEGDPALGHLRAAHLPPTQTRGAERCASISRRGMQIVNARTQAR